MSAENRCIVDYFTAANQGVREAIEPARQMVEAGTQTELGQYVVSCERCEADFVISAVFGQAPDVRVVTKSSPEPSKVCVEAQFRQPNEWVTNLSPRWFDLDVIKPKEKLASAEEGEDVPKVSLEGLEEVLNDAAQNVARDRRARDRGAAVLTPYALSTSRVLNKILPRQDDSNWGTEISERASNFGDQAT